MAAPNGLGINSFSGPMGEKEPAYGVAENMKILSKIGVQAPASQNAARRSQRRATSRRKGGAAPEAPPSPVEIPAETAPVASYDQQLVAFWQQLAAEPGASPLIQQIAAKALAGG